MRDGARDELSRYLAFRSREKGVVEKRRGMENQTVVGSIGIIKNWYDQRRLTTIAQLSMCNFPCSC